MRVHPVRASDRLIVIGVGITWRDRRRLRPGKAVLLPGWQLAVPMDDGGRARLIHKVKIKSLPGRERDARFFVRPNKAKYSRRLAIDVEGSGPGSQAKLSSARFGRGGSPRYWQEGDRAGHRNAGPQDLPSGQERGLFILSHCSFPISITFGN